MKKGLILLLFLYMCSVNAQEKYSINGIVTDAATGETIFGASIYFKDTSIGTITNEYGYYSINVTKGTYTIVISFVGYTNIEKVITVSSNLKKNYELEEASFSLDEIVLKTNSDFKRTNIRTPQMSTIKLSTKTIKEIPAVLGEVDIIKSIQLLPGVTNAGEGSSGFNVRGGAEDQNLVLLDEAIIYNTSHLFGFFSVFNADAIKDIKLYKGGIPSRFGGRLSSVLDIRQKDGNSKEFEMAGGIGSISSRLSIEGPTFKDKGSFLLAGRASYIDLFLKLANKKNTAGFYDVNLKTNYAFNGNNKIYLSAYLGKDNFRLKNFFVNNYGNFSANLRWNHIFSDNLFTNLSLIYSKYDYNLELNSFEFEWISDIKNYNIKYDVKYYLSDTFKFDIGVGGIKYDFNPGLIKPLKENSGVNRTKLDDKHAFEASAYVSVNHKITDKIIAEYGIRYSNFTRLGDQEITTYLDNKPVVFNSDLGVYEDGVETGTIRFNKNKRIASFDNFEPRVALAYQITDSSSVKLSYNKISQYLHLISNTTSAIPIDIWAPSGRFLKPQIGNQYAIGYFENVENGAYSFELEGYYKTVKNRVDYIDGANLIGNNTIETEILSGKSRAYGVEVLLRKNTGNLTGWLSYTWSKSEQKTVGENAGGNGINKGSWYKASYDRTHDISLTGIYKLNDKWKFGTNFIFQSGRPVTYPNGQFVYNELSIATYSNRNQSRLPSYHRLDISATLIPHKKSHKKWKGEWVFSIYNLYGRKNAASIAFGQHEDTGINQATRTAIFGIIPSITYNFKF